MIITFVSSVKKDEKANDLEVVKTWQNQKKNSFQPRENNKLKIWTKIDFNDHSSCKSAIKKIGLYLDNKLSVKNYIQTIEQNFLLMRNNR